MKFSPLLFVGSLALNAALVAVVAIGRSHDAADASHASDVPALPESGPAKTDQAAAPGPDTWNEMRGLDLPGQRNRLRAEGFPPATVRAIVAGQIRESFAARRKALAAARPDTPFWQNSRPPDLKTQTELRALDRQMQVALKELLGAEAGAMNGYVENLRRQLPTIPTEKIEQLAAIQERYNDMRDEFYARSPNGAVTAADGEKLNALEKAMRAEFTSVLSPQEFEDYQLRVGETANQLRYNLVAFDVTEAEFRTLFKLRSAYDEQFGRMYASPSQEQMRARTDAEKQLNDQIAAALGPDRYADYQRATDYNYRQTTQLVARLGLPAETAANLYAAQKDFEQRRNDLYRTMNNPAGREQAVQLQTAMAQEATARVTTLLGGNASALEAYKQYGGNWLQNLAPRPALQPPPPVRN